MAESAGRYVYRPLDLDRREFRLVKLKPSTQLSSPVCCELVETQLNNCPPYEAMSYVWGDPGAKAPVHVEDAMLHVTVNLECALRYFRWEHEVRWLWVDAISIYSYRTATKCCRNLRIRPQFCEGFGFASHCRVEAGILVNGLPVDYAMRFSGPVTAFTARRLRYGV
jgi:hypothetical protein